MLNQTECKAPCKRKQHCWELLRQFARSSNFAQQLPTTRNKGGARGAKVTQGELEWRSGDSTRLPPIWPGFKSRRRRHMWVKFVVDFLLCSGRFFSGYSGFPLSLKTNTSKFQLDLERTVKRIYKNS